MIAHAVRRSVATHSIHVCSHAVRSRSANASHNLNEGPRTRIYVAHIQNLIPVRYSQDLLTNNKWRSKNFVQLVVEVAVLRGGAYEPLKLET